jgi:RNA polymerase sigma factor (sigma-70 family)
MQSQLIQTKERMSPGVAILAIDTSVNQSYLQLRPYLFAVAYRMTGSASDAEDLVHDAWVRYLDAGSPAVSSLRAYLTTIVSRLSLDYLKSARVTREQYAGTWLPEPVLTVEASNGPAESVEEREAVSLALLALLERLTPEQRVVYVLREGFELSYEEIAGHLGRTAAACRQLFARGQNRLAGYRSPSAAPPAELEDLIERFMEAFTRGDAAGIAALLAEDVTWDGDGGPHRLALRRPITGRDRVSRGLAGFAMKAWPDMPIDMAIVDVNGTRALAVFVSGELERITIFESSGGRIATIWALMNPDKLRHLAAALGTRPFSGLPKFVPYRSKIA